MLLRLTMYSINRLREWMSKLSKTKHLVNYFVWITEETMTNFPKCESSNEIDYNTFVSFISLPSIEKIRLTKMMCFMHGNSTLKICKINPFCRNIFEYSYQLEYKLNLRKEKTPFVFYIFF